jgi:phosphoglycerol transferase MdoB-like AlkP superfamily enzyme
MEKHIYRNKFIVFSLVFFVLNIINSYLSSWTKVNALPSAYLRDSFMVVNSIIGDAAFFAVFYGLGILVFKSDNARYRYMIVLTTFFCTLHFVLSMFISNYGMFFSFWNLEVFVRDTGASESIIFVLKSVLIIIRGGKVIFFVPIIVLTLLYYYKFIRKDEEKKFSSAFPGFRRWLGGITIVLLGIFFMGSSYVSYKEVNKGTWYEDNASALYGAESMGLFNYYVFEAFDFAFEEQKPEDEDLLEEKIAELKSKLEQYKYVNQKNILDGQFYGHNLEYKGFYEDKNLILIQAESLNQFVIGLEVLVDGEYKELTPNINKMLEKSIYFNNFYTAVGIGNTSDSEFTILTGLYPTGNKYTVFNHVGVDYSTLPEAFKNKGYVTKSYHANVGYYYDRKNVHVNTYKFDEHISEEDLKELGIYDENRLVHRWISDLDFLRYVAKDVKEVNDQGEKLFGMPITVSTHMPYEQELNLFLEKDRFFKEDYTAIEYPLLGYLEHISYMDFCFGEFLEELETLGVLDNTIIAFYGDHGNSIDFLDVMVPNANLFRNKFREMYEVELGEKDLEGRFVQRMLLSRIPFVIYDHNRTEGTLIQDKVRNTTVVSRTISNLFNLKQEYYFGIDGLSNQPFFAYCPRNNNIYIKDMIISSQSGEYFDCDGNINYDQYRREVIIKRYKELKDFNDKLLELKIFPPLEEAEE